MSPLELYPSLTYESAPEEFSEEVDAVCDAIKEACKGFGTDEDTIITLLADKDAEMRHLISIRYEQKFGKNLVDVIKSEVGSRDLGFALQLLSLPIHEAEAMILQKAFAGLGTKENLIYPVLVSRSNKELAKLKATYFAKYEKDLGVKIASELTGNYERLIFHSIQGAEQEYDPEFFTPEKAEEDAEIFYEAGAGKFGTDEHGLFEVIAKSPARHLEKVNEIYTSKHERTLISALESELRGDVEKGAMFAVGMKLKPILTIAKLIKQACKGFGTDETLLTTTVIRYQSVLKEVNDAHMEMFDGSSLQDRIKSEVRGKFEKLLLAIVDAACA